MRVAYLLLVHDKLEQTKRLIRALNHPDNIFIIHADAKFTDFENLKAFAFENSNVFIVTTRFDIEWGGIDMVGLLLHAVFLT